MEQEVTLAEVAAPVLEGDDGVRVLVEDLLRVVAHVRVALGQRQRLDDVLERALVALAPAVVIVLPHLMRVRVRVRVRLRVRVRVRGRARARVRVVRVRVRATVVNCVKVRVSSSCCHTLSRKCSLHLDDLT